MLAIIYTCDFIVIVAHFIGIIGIAKMKKKWKNQHIILLNLSINSILVALTIIPSVIYSYIEVNMTKVEEINEESPLRRISTRRCFRRFFWRSSLNSRRNCCAVEIACIFCVSVFATKIVNKEIDYFLKTFKYIFVQSHSLKSHVQKHSNSNDKDIFYSRQLQTEQAILLV